MREAAHGGNLPAARERPRTWIDSRIPIISSVVIIELPPKLTNGSGIPVTGAIPIVMPDVDEDLEEEREHDRARRPPR